MYDDQQSMRTMNRAAYGDVPAAMMSGAGTVYGGAAMGMNNMMSDLGSRVMPVGYAAPARVHSGYYGMYQQHTGMMRGLAGMAGFESVPRGTTAMEYSYASASDFGERMGSGVAGGIATAGGMAAGYAMSPLMGAAGRAAGMAAGSAVGLGGVGSALGGLIGGSILPFVAASAATGAVMDAVGQRREIQSFLEQSSFRFTGAGSEMADPRLGGGMSRGARRETGEMIRKMDIADPVLDTKDLTNILQQGSQMGLFNGTSDMKEFQTKFKDITEAVKGVTKVLHQSLEEGMKTIRDLKAIGVDPSQVKAVVGQADTLGKMAGRTGSEMLGLGLQGAELFRGTGVTMGIGAQATMMNLASVRASRDAGTLSQEAIVQAGGEDALAMRQTASGLAFGQSAFGRGSSAAFFNSGMGGAGFNNQAFMANMMAGGGSFVGQAERAAGNLSSPSALIAYQANQEKFMSEMGKTFGGRGLQMAGTMAASSYASYMSQSTGANFEDAFRLSLKEQGRSSSEIEATIGEARGASKNYAAGQAAAGATQGKMLLEEAHSNFILNRIGAQVGDAAKNVVDIAARPLNKMIDNFAESAVRFKEEQLYGVQRASAGGVDLSYDFGPGAARKGPINLDRGGALAATAGSRALSALSDKAFAQSLGIELKSGKAGDGDVILRDSVMGTTSVSKSQLDSAMPQAKIFAMTNDHADHLEKAGKLKGVAGGLTSMFAEGRTAGIKDFASTARAVLGKDVDVNHLTEAQMAKLVVETRGTQMEEYVNKQRTSAGAVVNTGNAMSVDQLLKAREGYDAAKASVEGAAGAAVQAQHRKRGEFGTVDVKFGAGVAEKVAMANQLMASNPKEAAKLTAEAKAMQSRSLGNTMKADDIAAAIDGAVKSTANQDVRANHTLLKENRIAAGSEALHSAVELDLYSEKGAALDEKTRGRILTAVDAGLSSSENFMALADNKDLKKTDAGAAIAARAKALRDVKDIKSTNPAEIRKALGGVVRDDKQLAEITMQISQGGDKGKIVESLFDDFKKDTAGLNGTSAAGGSLAGSPGAANAQQDAALQTNINLQTLAALQSLAGKLTGGKR